MPFSLNRQDSCAIIGIMPYYSYESERTPLEHYLDNSATTAVSAPVAELVLKIMTEDFGNPSSLHRKGFESEQRLTGAREQLAAVLGCTREEIVFTSGGTEANNLALQGAAHARRRRGNRIVTTAIEHESVLKTVEALGEEGFDVVIVPPEQDGTVSPERFADACNEKTILASCMMVNSETGARNDIKRMAALCHRKNPDLLFHTDCVQAFCRYDTRPKSLGVELLSLSGHKIHAPKGTGALYVKKGVRLLPPLHGSGQELGLNPGTENVPGFAGLGLAAELMNGKKKENLAHFEELRTRLITNLKQCDDICINSAPESAPYIVNLSVRGIRSEIMIHFLEQYGIYVSSGSACSKGARSHVLTAMGLPLPVIDSAIRVSMTDTTTGEDIDAFCQRVLEGNETLAKIR